MHPKQMLHVSRVNELRVNMVCFSGSDADCVCISSGDKDDLLKRVHIIPKQMQTTSCTRIHNKKLSDELLTHEYEIKLKLMREIHKK